MPEPVRRLPWVLLGLLTIATFLGPVVILLVLQGGLRPGWPPDRPVEWVVFWGVCGAVVVLMVACLGVSLKIQSQIARSGEGSGRALVKRGEDSPRRHKEHKDQHKEEKMPGN